MPTYTTAVKRYIGGKIQEAGSAFTVPEKLDPLPNGVTETGLSPQQRAANTRAANLKAAKQKENQAEVDVGNNKPNTDAQDITGHVPGPDITPVSEGEAPNGTNSPEAATIADTNGSDVPVQLEQQGEEVKL